MVQGVYPPLPLSGSTTKKNNQLFMCVPLPILVVFAWFPAVTVTVSVLAGDMEPDVEMSMPRDVLVRHNRTCAVIEREIKRVL